MRAQKLGIIGVGHVGSQVLVCAVQSDVFGEIVLIDTIPNRAHGEALDHAHATGLHTRTHQRIIAGDYTDLADADIIIVAATHVYPQGELPPSRQDLLINNVSIIRQIMRDISAQTREAILIFITNPADTVVHIAATEFDYPAHLIIGTGCTLDSARLRYTIAQQYDIDPKVVSGYMLGEHGMTAFPAISHLTIAGMQYEEFAQQHPKLPLIEPEVLKEKVVQSAYEVFHAKQGVTNSAIAQVAYDIARSIALNERSIYPVSVLLSGQYGVKDSIAFSTPTLLSSKGVEHIYEVSLNEWEQMKLQESIETILASIKLSQSI